MNPVVPGPPIVVWIYWLAILGAIVLGAKLVFEFVSSRGKRRG